MSDDVNHTAPRHAPLLPETGVQDSAASSESVSPRAQARSLNPSDSPCVAVCSTLYDDICRGCGRTAMEVANWVVLDDAEKRQVWDRITAQGYPKRNR